MKKILRFHTNTDTRYVSESKRIGLVRQSNLYMDIPLLGAMQILFKM